jgi:hypothetical protein
MHLHDLDVTPVLGGIPKKASSLRLGVPSLLVVQFQYVWPMSSQWFCVH